MRSRPPATRCMACGWRASRSSVRWRAAPCARTPMSICSSSPIRCPPVAWPAWTSSRRSRGALRRRRERGRGLLLGAQARLPVGRQDRAVTADELARSYFSRARKRLAALRALMQEEAYPDVVREAQELVELALKGMLRWVGIEPPKWHDVGPILRED